MTFFEEFVSNTTAGTSNQSLFPGGEGVSRVFYRLLWGGTEQYSLLFSNTLDSTFADGTRSRANQLCGPWTLSVSCCASLVFTSCAKSSVAKACSCEVSATTGRFLTGSEISLQNTVLPDSCTL